MLPAPKVYVRRGTCPSVSIGDKVLVYRIPGIERTDHFMPVEGVVVRNFFAGIVVGQWSHPYIGNCEYIIDDWDHATLPEFPDDLLEWLKEGL